MSQIDQSNFEPTEFDHVWKDKVKGDFYYTDETSQAAGPFETASKAKAALDAYVDHELTPDPAATNLQNPEKLADLIKDQGMGGFALMMRLLTAPKVTPQERDAQIEPAVLALLDETEKARQPFAEEFPNNEEAVRFFAAGFLSAKYHNNLHEAFHNKKLGVPTYDDALQVIREDLLPSMYAEIPGTNLLGFLGTTGDLESEIRMVVSNHWQRYQDIHDEEKGLNKAKFQDECMEKSMEFAKEALAGLTTGIESEQLEEMFIRVVHHLQAEYIADAADSGTEGLIGFLTTTNLGQAVEDREEATTWFSNAIREICVDVENPDLPLKEQIWTWNQELADEFLAAVKQCLVLAKEEMKAE